MAVLLGQLELDVAEQLSAGVSESHARGDRSARDERVGQAELCKDVHAVGGNLQRAADRAGAARCRIEERGANAGLVEEEGERGAADPGADDGDTWWCHEMIRTLYG